MAEPTPLEVSRASREAGFRGRIAALRGYGSCDDVVIDDLLRHAEQWVTAEAAFYQDQIRAAEQARDKQFADAHGVEATRECPGCINCQVPSFDATKPCKSCNGRWNYPGRIQLTVQEIADAGYRKAYQQGHRDGSDELPANTDPRYMVRLSQEREKA